MGDLLKLIPKPVDDTEAKAHRYVMQTIKAVKKEARKHGATSIAVTLTYPDGVTYSNAGGQTGSPIHVGAVARLYYRTMKDD